MFNAANFYALDSAGYEFVVAATLHRVNKNLAEKILEESTFMTLNDGSKNPR